MAIRDLGFFGSYSLIKLPPQSGALRDGDVPFVCLFVCRQRALTAGTGPTVLAVARHAGGGGDISRRPFRPH